MTGQIGGRRSDGFRVFVGGRASGVEYVSANGWQDSTGQRQSQTQRDASGRTRTLLGEQPPTQISIDATADPGSKNYKRLLAARRSGESITLEFTADELEVAAETPSNSTAEISAAGVVTFAGDGHPSEIAVGDALKIDGKTYRIESIKPKAPSTRVMAKLSDNDVVVETPEGAVTAEQYSVVQPGMTTGEVGGKITQCPSLGTVSNQADALVTATVVFESAETDIEFTDEAAG